MYSMYRSSSSSWKFKSYLDLSFRAGLTADRADHFTPVHLDHIIINAQHALVPGAHINVVIHTRLHVLQVHYVVPERTEEDAAFLSK